MPQLIGVVLAGGKGSRIGVSKGSLRLGRSTLAEHAARRLSPLCGSVLISVASDQRNPARAYPMVRDHPPPERGPLAGIHAAFVTTGRADLLVLACDYPRVETSLLETIVSHAREEDDLVMLTDRGGRDHPLVALWRRSAEPCVREALERGYCKVRGLLPDLVVRRLSEEELGIDDLDEALVNVNEPDDLKRAGVVPSDAE